MADSLFLPLAAKSSNAHSSLFFRNCPSPSRLLPPKSSSLLLHGGEKKISVLGLSLYSRVSLPHRAAPIRALDSDVPHPLHKGMITALLGNLSLLSYFAKKRETEAVVVQTLGVISTFVVISQLAIGEAMPLPQYVATSVVVAAGLILNFLNHYGMLNSTIWQFWEDFITVGGLSVLPQIMWSTFVPYIPNSILPGSIAFVVAVASVTLSHSGKLSEKGPKFIGAISGWTATLLFMWMPVSQMWTNFLNPDNIKGLSAISMLLAMLGNGLLIPRALFIRDLMWFTGSLWATLFYGYGNIVCMYLLKTISLEFFLAATVGLIAWIGMALWRDAAVYRYNSPLRSLKELVFGS
ncbi:hypothetical protein Goklo_021015 [Gossypium klotzschianum]|uniref:Uncharacterized protein n=1 Tax=Gossypium klotzschianum TaxID=34286 RepID=A0A7J8UTW3_9ROSI|nr:hypothetical protein [Gossypium klotzschianum]